MPVLPGNAAAAARSSARTPLSYSLRLANLALIGTLLPDLAWAYVDPGLLASLTQLLWVAMLGAIGAWVIRPWQYMKGLFRSKESAAETSDASRDADVGESGGS